MVKAFLRAKSRGVEALRAWVNTFLCECFEEDGAESVEPMPLYSRREKYGKHVPAGVAILTAGIDIHPHRIELQVVGWGAEEECWPVEYKVFHGNTEKQQVWDEADRFLQIEYDHANGHKIAVERFCVDTRHKTDEAIAFCQARILRGAIPIKGIDGHGLPVMNLPRKTGIRKTRCWLVSKATSWKTLYSRLKLTTPGPGFIHFPSDREPEFDIEYFKQLTAAEVTTFTRGGLELQNFDAGSRRDEAADTWRYALAALRRFTEDMGKRLYKLHPRTPDVEEEQEEELGGVVKGRGFEL
jgi:phage terminase large subunit GpA-like protein